MTIEERAKGFYKEYKKISEKYQLDFRADVAPRLGIIDLDAVNNNPASDKIESKAKNKKK